MPNYCTNELFITGDHDELSRFLVESPIALPYCPWAEDGATGDLAHQVLYYFYCTPYAPQIPPIITASEVFQDLVFRLFYYEPSLGYQGVHACRAGVVLLNEYIDDWDPEPIITERR